MSYEVGQKVYITKIEGWDDGVFEAKIVKVRGDGFHQIEQITKILHTGKEMKSKHLINDKFIFKTKEEARDYFEGVKRTQVDLYKEEMNSVEDILNFCLRNDVSGENSYNDLTRSAVIEKMMEYGLEYEGHYNNYGNE